jgi:hypothetical protein
MVSVATTHDVALSEAPRGSARKVSRPVRLVAATRVRNEDDIIEAFVRHHVALADRLVLLDAVAEAAR